MSSAAETVKQRELSDIMGGDARCAGKLPGSTFYKVKYTLSHVIHQSHSIPLTPREIKIYVPINACTWMLTAALFIKVPNLK